MESNKMNVCINLHSGWKNYNVNANTLGEAAYKAIRESCIFLTDDNHNFFIDDDYVAIYKSWENEDYLVNFKWDDDELGAYWFSIGYKEGDIHNEQEN